MELEPTASFQDLVDLIRFEHGEEAAKKVQSEIDWQMQQEDEFKMTDNIVEFYESRGHSRESIEYWLPVIFD